MSVTLNPDNEFESALIEMVEMHRAKSKVYGTDNDPMQNFLDIAYNTGLTPLQACEVLLGKHHAAIKQWWNQDESYFDTRSDDGYLDRAVYGVIALVLYKRAKA